MGLPLQYDYQLNLSFDRRTGGWTSYVLEDTGDGHWHWIADRTFGPFEGASEVICWGVRAVVRHNPLLAR